MERKPRHILQGIDARTRLLSGALQLAKVVAKTYGPGGRTVVLDRFAGLLSTKDGVTVAREVQLSNKTEDMGCQILKQACLKVNEQVGDGTTTAAILAAALIQEGHQQAIAQPNLQELLQGVRDAAAEAVVVIRQTATPVKDQKTLEHVARIACNGDNEVAVSLAEACMAVGKDGTITVEDGHGVSTVLELKEGMELDAGAASPTFLEGERLERDIEGAIVAVVGTPLRVVEDVRSLMEAASQWPQNELVVFAPLIEGGALTTLLLNHTQKILRCCAVAAPGVHQRKLLYLQDIAALANASFIDPTAGYALSNWDAEWFGSFRRAHIRQNTTLLEAYPDANASIQARLQALRAEEGTLTSEYDRDNLRERMAKLSGGLAVLRVGGFSEAAMKERRARIEDALGAVKAALKEGVVPGAGSVYLWAGLHLAAGLVKQTGSDSYRAGW